MKKFANDYLTETVFLEKLKSEKYNKVLESGLNYIQNSKEKFIKMSVEEQAELLIKILELFKTGRTSGCDLRAIDGKEKSAELTLSSNLSNWKKKYTDIRIIDISASGIYEKQSDNLLELL